MSITCFFVVSVIRCVNKPDVLYLFWEIIFVEGVLFMKKNLTFMFAFALILSLLIACAPAQEDVAEESENSELQQLSSTYSEFSDEIERLEEIAANDMASVEGELNSILESSGIEYVYSPGESKLLKDMGNGVLVESGKIEAGSILIKTGDYLDGKVQVVYDGDIGYIEESDYIYGMDIGFDIVESNLDSFDLYMNSGYSEIADESRNETNDYIAENGVQGEFVYTIRATQGFNGASDQYDKSLTFRNNTNLYMIEQDESLEWCKVINKEGKTCYVNIADLNISLADEDNKEDTQEVVQQPVEKPVQQQSSGSSGGNSCSSGNSGGNSGGSSNSGSGSSNSGEIDVFALMQAAGVKGDRENQGQGIFSNNSSQATREDYEILAGIIGDIH